MQPTQPANPGNAFTGPRQYPRQMHILIAEDDPSLASALEAGLRVDGHAVDTVDRGESMLSAIDSQRFDCLIVDVGLPGIDGFDVVRRVRQSGHAMPVLILTARDAIDDRVRGFDSGADDYVIKPVALPELRARVHALLRRGSGLVGPQLVHGPLTLDQSARRAYLNDKPLDLAAREWAVLEVLLSRVEKVVSKEAIIQSVAGWDEELSPNAIEVYVSRLRAKLAPAGVQIRTVRGFGYMLEEFRMAVAQTQ